MHVNNPLFVGMWEHIRIGGSPPGIMPQDSSPGGDPSKYTEIKRQSFVDCSGCLNVVLCEILRTMMSLA
jgi:hypothetical protein